MDPGAGLNKIERLIYPVSAAVTFAKDDIPLLMSGDWQGIMSMEGGYLKSWHPPTLLGVKNAVFTGPVGSGMGLLLAGWAIGEVGKMAGIGTVGKLAGILEDSGKGVLVGGLADMLVRPTKYNPGVGFVKGAAGKSDPIMDNPLYYERTGKAAASAPLLPR